MKPIALVLLLAGAAAAEPPLRIDARSFLTIGDWLLGGASSGEVRLVPGGALRLDARLRGDKPFAGAWAPLRADGLPRDVTGYRALRFRVRGSPGSYLAGVRRREGKAQGNLMGSFTATASWSVVEVPFAKLEPAAASSLAFAPTGVTWLGITTGPSSPPDLHLEIDDVELIPDAPPDPAAVRTLELTDARALERLRFATLARDPKGDGAKPRLPDARELQMAIDPADDRVWFRFVLDGAPPEAWFGMNIALDVDGDPQNGTAWWGQNKAFHFDRLVTAYLNRGAASWQGMFGVADAADVAEGRFAARSADIRVAVDRAGRTLAVGVPRAALGIPDDGKVRLIGTVGSSMTFNDDVPGEGALDVVIPR